MFKVGDKVMCIKERKKVNIRLGQVLYVYEIDYKAEELDLILKCPEGRIKQWACSKHFVKVED